jgi:hypothetical protein
VGNIRGGQERNSGEGGAIQPGCSRLSSRRLRLALTSVVIGSALVLIGASAAVALLSEIPVLTTPNGEYQPVAADGYLGWQQNTVQAPRTYHAYLKPAGESPIRLNLAGTRGAMGGIDGDTLVYQQFRFNPDVSDLKFFNLTTRTRSNPPVGVNTGQWEYFPSISEPWLLFGREANDGPRR